MGMILSPKRGSTRDERLELTVQWTAPVSRVAANKILFGALSKCRFKVPPKKAAENGCLPRTPRGRSLASERLVVFCSKAVLHRSRGCGAWWCGGWVGGWWLVVDQRDPSGRVTPPPYPLPRLSTHTSALHHGHGLVSILRTSEMQTGTRGSGNRCFHFRRWR